METGEWTSVIGGFGVLTAVAGYLARKVIDHGEKIAGLLAHKDDVKERFDRQDDVLTSLNTKLDQVLIRLGGRPSPPPEGRMNR